MQRALPPSFFLVALIAAALLHFAAPIHTVLTFPFNLAGAVPLGLGLFLNIRASRQFEELGTTIKPFEQSTALVRDFPFSLSRNPMYLGMTLALLGVGLMLGSVAAVLPAVIFPVIIDRRFIRSEERMLEDRFPDEWSAYARDVRRWL